jgi:hypothetical protein
MQMLGNVLASAAEIRHLDAGFPQRLADPGRRTVRQSEYVLLGHYMVTTAALLRQSAEPGAPIAQAL